MPYNQGPTILEPDNENVAQEDAAEEYKVPEPNNTGNQQRYP